MNFFPKRTKYTKYQKGRIKNCLENKSNKLEFGFYGIQAIEQGKLINKQLETIRKTISNKIKKQGKL
jgi:large subunit ribosomal protein L16